MLSSRLAALGFTPTEASLAPLLKIRSLDDAVDRFLRLQEDKRVDYGAIPFPLGETRCLSRGQKLTDRMMDYLAVLLFDELGCDPTRFHIVPSFAVGRDMDWGRYRGYEKVLAIMHQSTHWFLLVYEPSPGKFHLYDTLASEEESPIDMEELPIADDDVVEDYYGYVPDQGASGTNCGVLTLLNMVHVLLEKPLPFRYDASPARINKVVLPHLSSLLTDPSSLDVSLLL